LVRVAYIDYSIPPDEGLQICPKHVEVYCRNKLRINSESSWFLLHRCIEVYGQQNIKDYYVLCSMEVVYRTEWLSVWRLSYLSALIYFTRNIIELSLARFTALPLPHCEHKHAQIWWSQSYSSIRHDTWPRCERRQRTWLSMNIIRYRLEETTKSDKTSGFWRWDSKQLSLNTTRLDVLGCDILHAGRGSSRFGKIQLPPTWDWTIRKMKGM